MICGRRRTIFGITLGITLRLDKSLDKMSTLFQNKMYSYIKQIIFLTLVAPGWLNFNKKFHNYLFKRRTKFKTAFFRSVSSPSSAGSFATGMHLDFKTLTIVQWGKGLVRMVDEFAGPASFTTLTFISMQQSVQENKTYPSMKSTLQSRIYSVLHWSYIHYVRVLHILIPKYIHHCQLAWWVPDSCLDLSWVHTRRPSCTTPPLPSIWTLLVVDPFGRQFNH